MRGSALPRVLPPLAFAGAVVVALLALSSAIPIHGARSVDDGGTAPLAASALADAPQREARLAEPDYLEPQGLVPQVTLPELPVLATPQPEVALPARPAALVLRVPVLMYHYISHVPAEQANSKVAVDLRVPPEIFEQHLLYLQREGYHSISVPLLWEALNGRAVLPPKPIVLTFDDGYGDAFTNAFPLLRRYGFTGTFFITVNLIGRPGYMTWDQVRALDAAGMDVESHAMEHKPMTAFGPAGLAYEMGTARQILSQQVGHEVRFFAYPSGDYNATAMQGAASNGYYAAFVKSGGSLQSLDWAYALRRTRVGGSASAEALKTALAR